jgi:hypothetical protein
MAGSRVTATKRRFNLIRAAHNLDGPFRQVCRIALALFGK